MQTHKNQGLFEKGLRKVTIHFMQLVDKMHYRNALKLVLLKHAPYTHKRLYVELDLQVLLLFTINPNF